MFTAMRMTLFRRQSCLDGNSLERAEECAPVEPAALLRDERKVARILPRFALVEPRIQHACNRQERLALHVRQCADAGARSLQTADCDRAILAVDVGEPKIANFRSPHAKTEGAQNHGVIALRRARNLENLQHFIWRECLHCSPLCATLRLTDASVNGTSVPNFRSVVRPATRKRSPKDETNFAARIGDALQKFSVGKNKEVSFVNTIGDEKPPSTSPRHCAWQHYRGSIN